MKKSLFLIIGILLTSVAGAQIRDVNLFLDDYFKIGAVFTQAIEEATTPQSVTLALQNFLNQMKPLVQRSKDLEKKYKDWGPSILEQDPLLQSKWTEKIEVFYQDMMLAMAKVYKMAAQDPSLAQKLELLAEEMEELWPSDTADSP